MNLLINPTSQCLPSMEVCLWSSLIAQHGLEEETTYFPHSGIQAPKTPLQHGSLCVPCHEAGGWWSRRGSKATDKKMLISVLPMFLQPEQIAQLHFTSKEEEKLQFFLCQKTFWKGFSWSSHWELPYLLFGTVTLVA